MSIDERKQRGELFGHGQRERGELFGLEGGEQVLEAKVF